MKTIVAATSPWVRIPRPPLTCYNPSGLPLRDGRTDALSQNWPRAVQANQFTRARMGLTDGGFALVIDDTVWVPEAVRPAVSPAWTGWVYPDPITGVHARICEACKVDERVAAAPS